MPILAIIKENHQKYKEFLKRHRKPCKRITITHSEKRGEITMQFIKDVDIPNTDCFNCGHPGCRSGIVHIAPRTHRHPQLESF
jgi:hypothetical protein